SEPAGKPLSKCKLKRIKLTLLSKEDLEIEGKKSLRYLRFVTISRLCWQAYRQGCLLTQDAKNKIASYAFINEILDPEVNASFATEFSFSTVSAESIQYMDEQTAGAYPYNDIQGYFEKAIPYPPTPTESDEYTTLEDWVKMWEQVKAAE
ncbi:unnamed protein product, partial [marine sediment metagenome]